MNQHDIFTEIKAELNRARTKFPQPKHTLAALTREVGELSQALLKIEYEDGSSHTDIFREAIQVAVMAIRIASEGDSTFPKYHPESGCSGKNWPGYKVENQNQQWNDRDTIFDNDREMSVELELVDGTFIDARTRSKVCDLASDCLQWSIAVSGHTDIKRWINRFPDEGNMFSDFPIYLVKRWREIDSTVSN